MGGQNTETQTIGRGEGIRGGVPALCYPDTYGPQPEASADVGRRLLRAKRQLLIKLWQVWSTSHIIQEGSLASLLVAAPGARVRREFRVQGLHKDNNQRK